MPNISGKLPPLQPTRAQRSSIQTFDPIGAPRLVVLQIASVADEAPSWPTLLRDQYLDRFWAQEPFLAGAIFSVASRNAAFRWEVTGPRRQVTWAQKLLSQADFGRGWQSLIMKLTTDLLTQDNGAFLEIIRPTRAKMFSSKSSYDAVRMLNPDSGEQTWVPYDRHSGKFLYTLQHGKDFSIDDSPLDLPVGLAQLDSQSCTRTDDPSRPVYYVDDEGRRHLLSSHQVIPLSEMPSPRKQHHGYQYCAVSRGLRLAQIIRDMLIYKHEKVSGRFARAIHLTNIDAETIQDAVDQSEQNADNKGLIRYSQPIVAATLDPNARPGIETIELASLPDGFSEDTSLRWYVAGLALDLGVDYGFLAPLPGNRLGTGTQAETAERQAKGKSSRLFINLMEHTINWCGILPRCTTFRFNTPDPYEESERDRALGRRARSLSILIKAGVITPEVAAQIAADVGDLDPQYLALMGLADLTPIVTMSGNDVQCDVRRFMPKPQPQQIRQPGTEDEQQPPQEQT
jgi:hypothetical protein